MYFDNKRLRALSDFSFTTEAHYISLSVGFTGQEATRILALLPAARTLEKQREIAIQADSRLIIFSRMQNANLLFEIKNSDSQQQPNMYVRNATIIYARLRKNDYENKKRNLVNYLHSEDRTELFP